MQPERSFYAYLDDPKINLPEFSPKSLAGTPSIMSSSFFVSSSRIPFFNLLMLLRFFIFLWASNHPCGSHICALSCMCTIICVDHGCTQFELVLMQWGLHLTITLRIHTEFIESLFICFIVSNLWNCLIFCHCNV